MNADKRRYKILLLPQKGEAMDKHRYKTLANGIHPRSSAFICG
jgi:hypothetical protein